MVLLTYFLLVGSFQGSHKILVLAEQEHYRNLDAAFPEEYNILEDIAAEDTQDNWLEIAEGSHIAVEKTGDNCKAHLA